MATLYVARDRRHSDSHDPGSAVCMDLLDGVPKDLVSVVDCTDKGLRATFLTGTPTLVVPGVGQFEGREAFKKLLDTVLHYVYTKGRQDATPPVPAKQAGKRQPSAPPASARVVQRAASVDDLHGEPDEDLFSSRIPEEGEKEEEEEEQSMGRMGKKLGSDDLAKAIRDQERSKPQGVENLPTPPPPPPME